MQVGRFRTRDWQHDYCPFSRPFRVCICRTASMDRATLKPVDRPMVTVGRSGLCGCVGALVLKRLCWRHHRVLRWQRIQRGNCNDIW